MDVDKCYSVERVERLAPCHSRREALCTIRVGGFENRVLRSAQNLTIMINPFSASPPHRTYARSARLILRNMLVLIKIVLLTTNMKKDF